MKWTPKELAFLKENYSKMDRKKLEKKLNRSHVAIKDKARILGLRKDNFFKWDDKKVMMLKEIFAFKSNAELAEIFNCKKNTIENKASFLGLKKDKSHLAKMASNLTDSGKMFQFKKGQNTHNKGKKMEEFMSAEQIAKVKKSQFKKGNIPHNVLPIGSIVERADSKGTIYTFIKVEHKRQLVLYQRYIWEQNYGPIPDGHIIRFKNGNTKDFDPTNLLCVSKKENMNMNTIHQYPMELKNLMRTNGRLKKEITNKLK